MRKRILSLLCVMALCLSLLPATALAAESNTVYVGGEALTGTASAPVYATTDDSGKVTVQSSYTEQDSWQIKWDGSTLTLDGAKIKGADSSGSLGTTVGIYASSNSGGVSLNIALKGVNEIFESSNGIWVYSNADDVDVTLTIEGEGSLNASGSSSGILVQSNSGNAALTIQHADVTAENSSYSGDGVTVRAGSSSSASLSVDGGSLTATGKSEDGAGIRYTFGGGISGSGTPSLTVSGNAMVKASGGEGGISTNSSTATEIKSDSEAASGGIVFNGNKGTVYGSVELQENLTIGEGESLTIPEGPSLTVPEDKTITVESGGKLEGTPIGNGTVKIAPTITTTESLPDGEVGTVYSQTLTATGDPTITWNVTSGTLPAGLTLNSDGTITGTPTTAGQFTFTATATNSAGSDSKEYELTINAPQNIPVNGVTLNPTLLSLFTGGSETLTATVEPSNATNKNVTWSSDKPEVATVENGKVTAKAAGTATITVTTEDGEKTATCTVTVTDKTYKISADATALDFGNAYTGYAQPAAKTVTITNDGNQDVTVTLPTSTNYIITAGTGFTNGSAAIEPDGTATFTVQPKAGLAVGTCSENITVTGTNNATLSITASFTVKQYSSGGGTPTKTPSQQAVDKIESAKEGSTVEITLRTGQTKLDKEVFEALAGRDVTLEISLPGGVSWTVNGQDIPENTDLTDLDLGVSMNTSTIPVSLINSVTGEVGTVQFTLKHNGEFGFTMTLTAPVGVKNAGLWANLYHYDEDAGKMVYQTAALMDEDGNVALPFDHASQYALVLDSKSHDLPFTDLAADAWYTDAVAYVYRHDLMAGYGENLFGPDDDLSRAQLCQIIYNMEGQPVTSGSSVFTDVADSAWYADAVTWAASQGIVGGYGGGLFGPEDNITREQLASILYRYAQAKGYDTSVGENTNILSYTDALEISEYAIPAMQWACGSGLVEGSNGSLSPRAKATRAEVATMLMRWMEQA